jgi:hypothetical protein
VAHSSTAAATAVTSSAAPTAHGISPDTQFTPLAAALLTVPAPVLATDGRIHLAYELLLTDVAGSPVRIDRVEIRDAATRAVLQTMTGTGLRSALTPVAGASGDESAIDPTKKVEPSVLASSMTAVLWIDLSLPAGAKVPSRLDHEVTGAIVPGGKTPNHPFAITVGDTATSTTKATVLEPPVKGGTWYMSEGCCTDDTHHRRGLGPINGVASVPQRFAIDFFLLDGQHRAWVGDPSKLTSYLTYRQPVIASAAGTIVDAQDGLPNNPNIPDVPKLNSITETVGNHVIEQIGPGVYVLYAHLDPGSVRVHVGDKVALGQQLGLIGTSGNSTTPHLHFQLLTTPTFFPTDSDPFTFDKFQLLGRIPDRIWDDNLGLEPTGTLPFLAASPVKQEADVMPLDRDVVKFQN